jgi:uncharacterized LabA/DUF88 family protein
MRASFFRPPQLAASFISRLDQFCSPPDRSAARLSVRQATPSNPPIASAHSPKQHERHQIYVKALQSTGVNPITRQFKEKHIYCPECGLTHKGHEEKESDVNIAVHLISDAYEERFDHAFIVSRDSDLVGPMPVR